MSGVLPTPLQPFVGSTPDNDGVVHERTRDLVTTKELGQGFRVQGQHIIVGDVTHITDRRPKAYEKLGHAHETKVFTPKRLRVRNTNKFDPAAEDRKHAAQARSRKP